MAASFQNVGNQEETPAMGIKFDTGIVRQVAIKGNMRHLARLVEFILESHERRTAAWVWEQVDRWNQLPSFLKHNSEKEKMFFFCGSVFLQHIPIGIEIDPRRIEDRFHFREVQSDRSVQPQVRTNLIQREIFLALDGDSNCCRETPTLNPFVHRLRFGCHFVFIMEKQSGHLFCVPAVASPEGIVGIADHKPGRVAGTDLFVEHSIAKTHYDSLSAQFERTIIPTKKAIMVRYSFPLIAPNNHHGSATMTNVMALTPMRFRLMNGSFIEETSITADQFEDREGHAERTDEADDDAEKGMLKQNQHNAEHDKGKPCRC